MPAVLDVITDPNVPPLPPHISGEHAKSFVSALLHRDPDALRMITASFKEVWDGMFPPRQGGPS